jgi:ubiquinone biosynthesis protein
MQEFGESVPDDYAVGSFTNDAPWVVDPDSATWRVGIDRLRQSAASQVPALVRPRRIPPLRSVTVVARLAWATIPWIARHRRELSDPEAQAELAGLLRLTFERLGCTFIKLGQLVASGEGMIPDPWVEEFKGCRDRVPPESFDHVRVVIEEDLGRPLESVFSSFDRVPVAAASIAQVHRARLADGQDVVVKVQRPGIQRLVADDIASMAWIAPIIARRSPQASFSNLAAYVEMFAETIVEELDFRLEAQNMLDVAAVLATVQPRSIVVPRPHPELVTRRVLVMERLEGISIDDEGGLADAGIDPAPVFRTLMVSFLEGAMIHGVFHGDLHAGNMFVGTGGRPAIFDFGITGRFDEGKRRALLGLMFSSAAQDGVALLRHFRDLGGLPLEVNVERMAQELNIDELMKRSPGEVTMQDQALEMREILRRLVESGGKLPKELFLYMKGMVYLSGAIARVAADIDMSAEIAHIFTVFTTQHSTELIAADLDISAMPDGDEVASRMRQQMGFEGETMTFRDMQKAQQEQSAQLRASGNESR